MASGTHFIWHKVISYQVHLCLPDCKPIYFFSIISSLVFKHIQKSTEWVQDVYHIALIASHNVEIWNAPREVPAELTSNLSSNSNNDWIDIHMTLNKRANKIEDTRRVASKSSLSLDRYGHSTSNDFQSPFYIALELIFVKPDKLAQVSYMKGASFALTWFWFEICLAT